MGKISDTLRGIPLDIQHQQKIVALDKQFEACESQVNILQAENLKLRAEVNPLKHEVERLKQQIEQQKAPSHNLEQTEIEMLVLLANHPRGLTSPQIAGMLKQHQAKIEHFLKLLREKELITFILDMGTGARYVLDHKGNEYVVKNDLV